MKEHFETELIEESSGSRTASLERNHQETVAVWRCYCHLVDEIQSASHALGKDGKFQLFICLSVRYINKIFANVTVDLKNCLLQRTLIA